MSKRHLKLLCLTLLLQPGVLSAALAQPPQVPPPPQPPPAPAARPTATVILPSVNGKEDMSVAIELRIVNVPQSFREKMPFDLPALAKQTDGVAFLDGAQLSTLMESMQGNAKVTMVAAPKLTTFDGQQATIQVGDTQFFVTGVDLRWNGEQMLAVPRNEPYCLGMDVHFTPHVTADHRFICLTTDAKLRSLESAPLSPVTSMVTPIYEGGAQGAPVPFTQYVQQPRICKIAVNKTLCIPDGGTALFFAGKRQPGQGEVPVLTRIPYASIFRPVFKKPRETEHVLFLITPRIILDEQAEMPATPMCLPPLRGIVAAPTPVEPESGVEESELPALEQCCGWSCPACPGTHVQRLMEQYRAACAAGHKAEAKELAEAALEIDPTCFSKGK